MTYANDTLDTLRKVVKASSNVNPVDASEEIPTTADDFELFQTEFLYWQNKLGLINWQVVIFHEKSAARASIGIQYPNKQASVLLSTTWDGPPTEYEICRSAYHECMHLLLSEMAHAYAKLPGSRYDRYITAEHGAIRVLELQMFTPDFIARRGEPTWNRYVKSAKSSKCTKPAP